MDMDVSPPPEPLKFEEQSDGTIRLEATQWIQRPLEEVFRFFSQPENLHALTPTRMNVELLTTTPVDMRAGRQLTYRLRVKGLPIRWTSQIVRWDPPHSFRDIQLKGPYRKWDHTHRFERDGCGTRVIDDVRYSAPGPRWMERAWIRPDVRKIFQYRHRTLEGVFRAGVPNLA